VCSGKQAFAVAETIAHFVPVSNRNMILIPEDQHDVLWICPLPALESITSR